MINYEKIRKLNQQIKKNNEKLGNEKDYNRKEILKLKIRIDEFKIKIERLK